MPRSRERAVERFWERVDVRGPDDCWPWLKKLDGSGYGVIQIDGRKVKAHRFGFELAGGVLVPGLELDHLCHDAVCRGGICIHRRCCNPSHVRQGTHRENTTRGLGPTALNAQATACQVCGGPYVQRKDRRACPPCDARRSREYRARK